MNDHVNRTAGDIEFPLDSYIELYKWIGNWAETALDGEQRKIADAAIDSLTAVGVFMRDTMRTMAG